MTDREEFEAWISAPPFERDPRRNPDDPVKYGWPGNYREQDIDLAWCAWEDGREKLRAENAALKSLTAPHDPRVVLQCIADVAAGKAEVMSLSHLPVVVLSKDEYTYLVDDAEEQHRIIGRQAEERAESDMRCERLEAENAALKALVIELRRAANCATAHHKASERHSSTEPCPVMARFDAAIDAARGEKE